MHGPIRLLWNPRESRLRALWRQLLAIALYVLAVVIAVTFPALPAAAGLGAFRPWLQQPLPWLAAAVCALGGMWLLARFVNRERLGAFGLRLDRDWLADLVAGLCLALLMNTALFLVEVTSGRAEVAGTLHGGFPPLPYAVAALSPLLLMVFVSLVQDPLLRAYTIRNLAQGFRGLGPRPAILLSAAVSVVLVVLYFVVAGRARGANPNAIAQLNLALGTVMFAVAFVSTGRLGLTIGLHVAWDFSQGNVFGFPLAGLDRPGLATLFVVRQSSADAWTGPAGFGPIGGLLETAAFVVAIALVLAYVHVRYGRVAVAAGDAVHRPVAAAG